MYIVCLLLGWGREVLSPDLAVCSSTSSTSVLSVHFMSLPLPTASTGTGTITGGTSSSTVHTRSAHVCNYGDASDNCILQREATLPVAQNISGGEKTSFPVIYLAVYKSTSYSAMAVQQLEGTEYFMTSVQPPVYFGETTYVEDTEYDDVLTDELAEKIRMMVLLQDIECDE